MAISPIDLQVLFMQESRVAKSSDKQRRFQNEIRERIGRRTAYKSLQETVEEIEPAESRRVDEDGRQGSGGYVPQRRPSLPASTGEEEKQGPDEEGKGEMFDVRI